MSPTAQVLLSGALTFGIPLVLAFRELHMLRRPNRGAGWGGDPARPVPPSPMPSDPAAPSRPLPECLIVAARGLPARHGERLPEVV